MSESNNNIPMRITQLEEATAYEDGMYYAVAKAGSGTKKILASTNTPQLEREKTGFSKTNFYYPPNILNINKIKSGCYINGSTGNETQGTSGSGLNCCTDFLKVFGNTQYYVMPANLLCNSVFYNENKERISSGMVSGGTFTTPNNAQYVRMSFVESAMTNNTSVSKVQSYSRYITILNNVTNLKSVIDTNYMTIGSKTKNSPFTIVTATNRCVTDFLWTEETIVNLSKDYKIAIYLYDKNLNFEKAYAFTDTENMDELVIKEGRFCVFAFAFLDDSDISTNDFEELSEAVSFKNISEIGYELKNQIEPIYQIVKDWRNGSVGNLNNQYAVSFVNIEKNYYSDSVTILIDKALDSGHKYRYQLTTYSIDSGLTKDSSSYRISSDVTALVDSNYYTFSLADSSIGFAIALYEKDENDTYVPLRVDTFDTNCVKIIRNHTQQYSDLTNYAMDAAFRKTPVTLELQGTLSALQAFCKYNGYYYSTNGTDLYKQDSSFEVIDSATINAGHGNSLQLGTAGKAYVSGWDDNKVYVVDLPTMAVDFTINLPVEGYTTCAVDDLNHLIYIFYRPDYPNIQTYYQLITYDYLNNQTVSSRKITRSLGAMQAVDFLDGRIFMLYGTGTADLPNGYVILNTVGDIISEYVIGTYSSTEPESVFVDRDTKEVYISYVNKNVYKII